MYASNVQLKSYDFTIVTGPIDGSTQTQRPKAYIGRTVQKTTRDMVQRFLNLNQTMDQVLIFPFIPFLAYLCNKYAY